MFLFASTCNTGNPACIPAFLIKHELVDRIKIWYIKNITI